MQTPALPLASFSRKLSTYAYMRANGVIVDSDGDGKRRNQTDGWALGISKTSAPRPASDGFGLAAQCD
jgi:hypothetical protein